MGPSREGALAEAELMLQDRPVCKAVRICARRSQGWSRCRPQHQAAPAPAVPALHATFPLTLLRLRVLGEPRPGQVYNYTSSMVSRLIRQFMLKGYTGFISLLLHGKTLISLFIYADNSNHIIKCA